MRSYTYVLTRNRFADDINHPEMHISQPCVWAHAYGAQSPPSRSIFLFFFRFILDRVAGGFDVFANACGRVTAGQNDWH